MILLDGKTLSTKILAELKEKIRLAGKKINLDIILVGHDPSSIKYVKIKQQRATEVGIDGKLHQFSNDVPQSQVVDLIKALNGDTTVHGFFVQLPLPPHFQKNFILNSINPLKDADGLVVSSGVVPAVVRGIIQLLDEYKLSFADKKVVIVNDSQLIGFPLKRIFETRHSQVVLCNSSTQNLGEITKTADLLISATGEKNIITTNMVKNGVVAMDVATGDIDFDNISQVASYITPTIGGVGPMTVASLLQNTFDLVS